MRTRNATPFIMTHLNSLILVGVFIILAAVVAVPVYSGGSSSTPTVSSSQAKAPLPSNSSFAPWSSTIQPLLPIPQSSPEAIYTYASDCTTPKIDFNLGETVCAKANGVPVTLFPWHVLWLDPAGNVRQSNTAIADDQATYSYTLPTQPTSIVNGELVDNRGTWRVNLARANGVVRQTAMISVHEPANPRADIYVQKFNRNPDEVVTSGGSVAFILLVGNDGPDPATSVHLVDSAPMGSTLASFSQQSGPSCLPNGTGDCTIATLNSGQRAEFTVVYNTGTSAPGTYTTSASVSSTTTDPDTSDNSSTATFEIGEGGGGSQCTLTCPTSPAAVNNEAGQNGATVDWDGPNNDNVPVATGGSCGAVSVSTTSPHFFSIGSTPVTVTTESGEECTFSVTVLDVENPDIGNCPANITVTEDVGTPGEAIVNYPTPSATDNSGTVTVDCSAPSGSSFTVAGSPHTVTCTATDSAGNTDSCTFSVTVTGGTTECTLTPPANITVDSNANQCGANVTYQNPTQNGTSCGTVSCDHASGSFFPVGTTVVSCRDTSGATTQFNVTVNDITAPVPDLATLPTITRDCTAIAGVPTPTVIQTPTGPVTIIVMEPPTATDNCGGSIAGTTEDPRTYQDPGTFIVHWTYTDASGNTTTQNQTITVTGTDTTAPVPDVANLPTATGECEVTVIPPTATDDCDGTITATTPDPLTYVGAGTYTVHWTYTDLAGHSVNQNQTVIVTDVTNPTIALVGASSITVECHTSFDDPGVTTTDNCLPKNVTVATTGAFDINTPNTYTLTYTATDGGGNQASVQRTVIVQDTIKPVITLTGGAMTVECHTSFTDPGVTASDSCDASVPVAVSGTVDVNTPGTYVLTYNASDDSGNQADSVQRTVIVQDTIKPVITLTGGAMTVECHTSFTDPGATASDSCDASVPVAVSGTVNVNTPGTYVLTYNASDDSGNAADSVQRTVTVVDTTAPTITLNGATPSMWPPNHKYKTFGVTNFVTGVTESCDTTLGVGSVVIEKVTSDEIENGNGDGNTFNDIVIAADCKSVQLRSEREGGGNGRVYTIFFKVTDASGNVGTATAKVVVQHNPGQTAIDSGVHYTVTCGGP